MVENAQAFIRSHRNKVPLRGNKLHGMAIPTISSGGHSAIPTSFASSDAAFQASRDGSQPTLEHSVLSDLPLVHQAALSDSSSNRHHTGDDDYDDQGLTV